MIPDFVAGLMRISVVLQQKAEEEMRTPLRLHVCHNLAHLSIDAVRRFYERAHEDCRMIYDRLPSPKQIHTFLQVWKQLWKWR